MLAAELAHRRGRAPAMPAGIAVATASFTVLAGASESSRLEVELRDQRGTTILLATHDAVVAALLTGRTADP